MVFSAIASFALVAAQGSINDDRDVIQTAMLSFFKWEEWHDYNWRADECVLLDAEFWGESRADFNTHLRYLISNLNTQRANYTSMISDMFRFRLDEHSDVMPYLAETNRSLAALRRIADQSIERGYYKPPGFIPIASIAWDSRISVGEQQRYFRSPIGSIGRFSTFHASVTRPSYSRDGNYALVKLAVPSAHGAIITLVFERNKERWIRLAHHEIFFL